MALRHDIAWIAGAAVPTAAVLAVCQYLLRWHEAASTLVSVTVTGLVIGAVTAARFAGMRALVVGAACPAAAACALQMFVASDEESLSGSLAVWLVMWLSTSLFAIWYRSRVSLESLAVRGFLAWVAFLVTGCVIVLFTGLYNLPSDGDVLRQTRNGALMLAAGLSALHLRVGGRSTPAPQPRGFPVEVTWEDDSRK